MTGNKMVDKIVSMTIILILSLAVLPPLMVSVAHAAEFEAGADPSFVQASTVLSLHKPAFTFSSESDLDYNYVSHVFTVADVIFFSYVDGTMLALYDSSGTLIWNNGGNPLNKGGHAHVSVPQGVYTACGSEKFAVLTGDPITRYVLGYYAMDQNGYGVSTELYTWVPLLYGHCSFIVFGYEDNTQVTVDETDTGINIATFTLNKGRHWQIETLQSKWLHITANHPVSALTCYDQGYLVPSANGRWSGTEFYTYVSDIQRWPEDLTVISYNDDTLVTIKDSNTGSLVWSGEVDDGQAHVESFPSGANRFFTITSSKSVTVAVQPWVAMTSNYHQGLYIGDSTGTRLGTDLIGSTLNGGYLYILAYRDHTNVVVYNSRTGAFVKSYTLNDGDYVEANPGNGLWRIMSNYPVSAYSGWGQWNAEFAPVEFREVTPVKVNISAEKKCYATGEGIDLRVKVTDANGNPLYPLKKTDFKVSVDGTEAEEYDERIEKAIYWALGKLYSHEYDEKCLRFVWDAYEKTHAGIPSLTYECAKEAADALDAKDNPGVPPHGAYAFYESKLYPKYGHVGLSLGDTNGDGKTEIIHAYTKEKGVVISDDYNNIGGCTYIGWAWPPTMPPIAFERVSAIDYRIKIKAPETIGTYSITLTVTVVTGKGTSTTEIKVYAIEGVSLTVGGNRLTQYENSADTPIFYRGDSNIYPIFYIDVEVNGATLQEVRNYIWVYTEIKDHTEVKDKIGIKAVYDSVTSKFKAHWKNSPSNYPVGKYDTVAKVEDSNSKLLVSSENKYFYFVFKPPSGYEDYVNGGTSTYNQFDVRLWKAVLETITGEIVVESAAKKLLLFAHGIAGSYYGYWHMMMDETKSNEEQKGFVDPTHQNGDYFCGDQPLSGDYDACGGYVFPLGWVFAEPFPCPRIHLFEQNAWWKNMIDFVESDFDPEGKAEEPRPTGVCADYAKLFVSNARSAGIPAREQSGVISFVFDFPPMIGHAWAEIFNGDEWIHCEPTWYQYPQYPSFDSSSIRILYNAPDVYANDRGFYFKDNSRYRYNVQVSIDFGSDDYDYPDWVDAVITVENVGNINIERDLYLKVLDKPTIARLGLTHLITDIHVGTLNVGDVRTYNIEYQLPEYGPLNDFYEWIGDRYLVVIPHFEGKEIIRTLLGCMEEKDADIAFCEKESKVPGLCPEWDPLITVDSSTVTLNTTTVTSLFFNDTTNELTEVFDKPENIAASLTHKIIYYVDSTKETWYVFNPSSSIHEYSLTTPLVGIGDAVYISGYGSVTANQTINVSTNYIVIYNTTVGTNGFVDIYVFSRNITLKDVRIFNGVTEIVGAQNCTLSPESGIFYLVYLSMRSGNGKDFDEIYDSFAQEVISNGDTLTQLSIEGEHEQLSYYQVGDIIYIRVNISNNGVLPETRNLVLTLTEPSILENGDLTENEIYSAAKTVVVPAGSETTVSFEYEISLDSQIGKHRIIVCNKIAKATTIFMIQPPFNVTLNIPATVTQAQEFLVNATITNALGIALSGINVTIDLPNDFHTSESLTKDIGALLSGESVHVSWLVTATDFEYGYAHIRIYINSAEGAKTIASTSLTVLRLPEIKIFTTAPTEARPNIPFGFTINVTNQGDLSLQSVSVSLQLPDDVTTADSLTKLIGDLTPWETKSISWTITSMLHGDFWITANASDITNTHSAQTTELINVVQPEIELNVSNPVEVILNQEFLLTSEIKNIGELVATDVKVSLTLPSELITMDPIDIDVAYLSPGQTEVIEWTTRGITPGYAEITVNASASSVSVTRGIIITYFPLSVKTDKKTYLSGDNVIITTTTTNENPEVSYVDLSVNVTIDGPSLQDSYSMPIDFISSLETRNFALTWDSTGKPFGNYVVTAKLLENTITLNETSTSFTLTTVDEIPPTTLLTIDEPKYLDLIGNVYVCSATPSTLVAEDNPGGTGVASTFYRIYNSSYDTDWLVYSAPFYPTGLTDGEYSIDYYSTDNIGNIEPTNTATVMLDNTPPATALTIGEPKYISDTTYVTPDTSFTLEATDTGSGVYSTAYRIYNTTYNSGWQTYTAPFYLTSLTEGPYTIEYNSTDNVGNVETIQTVTVTLFSWNYVFKDTYGRGTVLKINIADKFIQFITPDRDHGVRNATYMRVHHRTITIRHEDNELRLITLAVDTKLDFCVAIAWDKQTRKQYLLIDKPGIEN